VLDPPGATEPPAVTTTGTNLFFLQQPTNVSPGALIAPPVRVRIWDNTGAPLPGVTVSIALDGPPAGVLLSGTTTAVADGDGIAEFTALSVNLPATGLRLRATATSPGAVAAGTSAPFDVSVVGAPVSLWHADGDALDSLGGNHGTLQGGASFGPGRIGPAFSLNGAGQYVLVPDDPSLRLINQLTLSAWIYPTGPGGDPTEGGMIVNKEWAYEVARFPDGTIRWAFGDGVGSFAPLPYWITSGGTAPLNAWTHVAVTFDNGTVTTYINGTSMGAITPPGMVLGAGPHTLRIGGREYPNSQYFDGRIDEVGIQDRALTAGEVVALYNGALPATPVAVSLGNTSAVFDGAPKAVTVTTTPPGVPVTVIYGSGLAAPSAIGAYGVQAIVSQNGYAGSAGATLAIASTPAAGGPGGGPYPASGALSCGPGIYAIGLRAAVTGPPNEAFGNIDYALTSGQLLCGDANHPVKFGGGTTPNADLVCPVGQVMVGGQHDLGVSTVPARSSGASVRVAGQPAGGPIVDGPGPRCLPPSACPSARSRPGWTGRDRCRRRAGGGCRLDRARVRHRDRGTDHHLGVAGGAGGALADADHSGDRPAGHHLERRPLQSGRRRHPGAVHVGRQRQPGDRPGAGADRRPADDGAAEERGRYRVDARRPAHHHVDARHAGADVAAGPVLGRHADHLGGSGRPAGRRGGRHRHLGHRHGVDADHGGRHRHHPDGGDLDRRAHRPRLLLLPLGGTGRAHGGDVEPPAADDGRAVHERQQQRGRRDGAVATGFGRSTSAAPDRGGAPGPR
ncbi:MAG: LamG-like jellyroll fold domain-containing protein, partial [Vicinamibacterales bacterium]